MLDWIRLRECLGDCRRAKAFNVAQLAHAIGVDVTTIYRIENVKKNPDYKPELETIAAWAEATGFSLSSVFFRVESLAGGHETRIQTGHTREGGPPSDRAVSAASSDSLDVDGTVARALQLLVEREFTRRQAAGAPSGSARTRTRPRKHR